MSKTNYNRTYYLSRREELKAKARYRQRIKRAKLEPSFLLLALVSVSSFLLLSEMAFFYESWIRAAVFESLVLIFSVLSHPSFFRRILYKSIAFGICALSVYGMSVRYLEQGVSSYRESQIAEKQLAELEDQIREKKEQADRLKAQDWITAARKSEKLIDELRFKLDSVRASYLKMRPMVLHTVIIQILARVFLMLGNILLVQKLFETLETSTFSLKHQDNMLSIGVGRKLASKPAHA